MFNSLQARHNTQCVPFWNTKWIAILVKLNTQSNSSSSSFLSRSLSLSVKNSLSTLWKYQNSINVDDENWIDLVEYIVVMVGETHEWQMRCVWSRLCQWYHNCIVITNRLHWTNTNWNEIARACASANFIELIRPPAQSIPTSSCCGETVRISPDAPKFGQYNGVCVCDWCDTPCASIHLWCNWEFFWVQVNNTLFPLTLNSGSEYVRLRSVSVFTASEA